jgi:RHS repeat-associated protein
MEYLLGMGYYAAATTLPEKTDPPSKNRVGVFSASARIRARRSSPQPLELHRVNRPIPTETASGVRYYGYRFLSPEMGWWISRDPIGERGGINLYGFVGNFAMGETDYLGLLLSSTVYYYNVSKDKMPKRSDGSSASGGTKSLWFFTWGATKCNFLSGKEKIDNYSGEIKSTVQIAAGEDPNAPNLGGYTLLGHEEHHRDISDLYAATLDRAILGYVGICECPPCVKAIDSYLVKLRKYYIEFAAYENDAFDCSVYVNKFDKSESCAAANEKLGILRQTYNAEVLPALEELKQQCP